MARRYDALVVGAGLNSLVTAVYLARAGWRTLVLEAAARPGGAVQSAEVTRPGFVHDLFATNMGPFLGSPVFRQLGPELEELGLRFAPCARPFANVYPGGRALRVYQGLAETYAELEGHDRRDAEGWRELDELYRRIGPLIFKLFGSRPDPVRLAALALSELPSLARGGARELAQLLVSSTREIGDAYLSSPEAKALIACWGLHLDCGPDVAGGATIPFVEAFTDMRTGIAVVRGGAGRLIDSLVALGRRHGMELQTGAEVTRILVDKGRATGVELVSGERFEATRAVVAGVAPRLLYGCLLADAATSPSTRRAASRFRYGPGTMMVHLALSEPPTWDAGADLGSFGYVHIGPYIDELATTYAEALAGLLPAEPMLIVGQTSSVDSSRAAAGAILWVQVRALPATIRGDARGSIAARSWEEAAEPYADRVLAKLEHYCPGLRDLVIDRAVLTPRDLERAVPNLVGGDSIGGSMHLRQSLLMRPFPGVGDYETGVDGLLMVGAAAWPGGGVSAVSGFNAAQKLLSRGRRRETAKLFANALHTGVGGLLRQRHYIQ